MSPLQAEPIPFEVSCQTYIDGKVGRMEAPVFWELGSDVKIQFDADVMKDLQHGFCIFGPVDVEYRTELLKERFEEYRQTHPNPLDSLQVIPSDTAPAGLK